MADSLISRDRLRYRLADRMEVVMDGSQFIAEAARSRGTSEGKMGRDWATDQYQFDTPIEFPHGSHTLGHPENRYDLTTLVKFTNIIIVWLMLLVGLLAIDFVILWIAADLVIRQMPF